MTGMDLQKLEAYDGNLDEIPGEDIEIDGIEDVFAAAEAMRQSVAEAFSRECGVHDVFVASGGIRQQAYWGWESVVQANGEAFASSIELLFEGNTCSFYVSVSRVVEPGQVVEWTAEDSCGVRDAVDRAFEAFHGIIAEIADEDETS